MMVWSWVIWVESSFWPWSREVTSRWSSMSSRATASAGRGPTRLPASAPVRTAALKMATWRIRMNDPPKGLRATGRPRSCREKHKGQGEADSTLIREPRGGKGWPTHAALCVTHRLCCEPREWERSVCSHEMAAAVLLPAGLGALHAEGLFLAEAHGADAVGGDAERYDVLLHGAGAAVAQAQVVFSGPALVAVAFDDHFEARIAFQEIGGFRERGASIGTNVGFVVVEIGVAHFTQEKFVVRGARGRRRRWRRRGYAHGGSSGCGAAGTVGGNGVGRGVGGRDLGRALSRHSADFGRDGELRGIGGIPAQS